MPIGVKRGQAIGWSQTIISPSRSAATAPVPIGLAIARQAIRFRVVAERPGLRMKLREAVVRAQPEIPLIVFQNRLDRVVGQAVSGREAREAFRGCGPFGSGRPGYAIQRVPFRSSQMAFTWSWLRLARILGVVAVNQELLRCTVEPVQSVQRPQP